MRHYRIPFAKLVLVTVARQSDHWPTALDARGVRTSRLQDDLACGLGTFSLKRSGRSDCLVGRMSSFAICGIFNGRTFDQGACPSHGLDP